MPPIKLKHLISVLTFITFIAAVHSYSNALYSMITENEDLSEFTVDLKNGRRRFARDQIETFIEMVRNIKLNARDLEAGASARFWQIFGKLITRLRATLPSSHGLRVPINHMYSSAVLEGLDEYRRLLLKGSYAIGASYERYWRETRAICLKIKELVNTKLGDKTVTVNHVCTSLHSCANVARPYEIPADPSAAGWYTIGHYAVFGTDDDVTAQACTADLRCNVEMALPLMTGLFYSKVYEVAGYFKCCQEVDHECKRYVRSSQEMKHEADVLIAYAHSHPGFWTIHWSNFFRDAVSNNAHQDIDVVTSMLEEKMSDFEILRIVCGVLQFAEACEFEAVYQQYLVVKRNQQNRNNPTYVKDLRLNPQMDHAKLLEMLNLKLEHLKILGSVRNLDENLQASVSGISTFYEELAKFDQGIADADAAFVTGELEKYTTTLSEVQDKLNDDLGEAMNYMIAVISARLAEKITVLGLKIATDSNPVKLVLTGPDLADIAGLANDVADAGADLAKATSLITSLTELARDTEKFADAFIGNSGQLSTVESLKDQILAGQSNNLNEDANIFLEQYSAYTPQTDRSSLARNDALWSAFKDSTCDLLFTDSGVISAIPKGIAGAKLLCERLEGTLAQFFTLREDIFDFQFQLIDAMARIVRGNLAQRLAENIRGNGEKMTGAQLLTTFLLVQSDLQTVASTYCDVIEYKQLGRPLSGCATFRGLFRKENLEALIAYNPNSVVYHEVERFVTIPTQPNHPGDTGYIDLSALASKNEVLFMIPKNRTWLDENRWTIPGQRKTEIPFVKAFEIYLPHKSYEFGSIPTSSTMEITIKSIAGSFLSTLNPNTGIAYLLPRGSGTYLTSYEENYFSCSKKIDNPYSLCENLPQLCVLSSRYPREDALLPTILSTWSIRLRRAQGSRSLTWEAPHSSTNLSLAAKLVLQAPSLRQKRSSLKHAARSDVVNSKNGCCENNRYRVNRMVNQECATCPAGSTALLSGLYCEIDQPPEPHAKRILPTNRKSHHHKRGKSSRRRGG